MRPNAQITSSDTSSTSWALTLAALEGLGAGEVSIQPLSPDGDEIGEPISYKFSAPGAGQSIRLSLKCDKDSDSKAGVSCWAERAKPDVDDDDYDDDHDHVRSERKRATGHGHGHGHGHGRGTAAEFPGVEPPDRAAYACGTPDGVARAG